MVRGWDEPRLQQALLPASRLPSGFVEPDWARVHQDLRRKGVTRIRPKTSATGLIS